MDDGHAALSHDQERTVSVGDGLQLLGIESAEQRIETRQRVELDRFDDELRGLATREKAPGAPTRRRGFFTF